jgi:YggT family protein
MRIVAVFDVLLAVLRPAIFGIAVVVAIAALMDWLVRTRRISPFSPVARFSRDTLGPVFKPAERMVLRAGGNPQTAPFWALALAVLGGIVLISLVGFVRNQVVMGFAATQAGPNGLIQLLLMWTFQLLRLALIVRVISSWVRVSPYSKWVRWAFTLTDPIIRPLSRIIPPLGMIDISPIVAYFLLGLLERVVLGLF